MFAFFSASFRPESGARSIINAASYHSASRASAKKISMPMSAVLLHLDDVTRDGECGVRLCMSGGGGAC